MWVHTPPHIPKNLDEAKAERDTKARLGSKILPPFWVHCGQADGLNDILRSVKHRQFEKCLGRQKGDRRRGAAITEEWLGGPRPSVLLAPVAT